MWMTIIGQFAVIIWVKNDDKRLQILINIILGDDFIYRIDETKLMKNVFL